MGYHCLRYRVLTVLEYKPAGQVFRLPIPKGTDDCCKEKIGIVVKPHALA